MSSGRSVDVNYKWAGAAYAERSEFAYTGIATKR